MDRLIRRVQRDYAAVVAALFIVLALCGGFVAYVVQIRALEVRADRALAFYVARAQREPPITRPSELRALIAGTNHPGWEFDIGYGTKRLVASWPLRKIESAPRTSPTMPPFPRSLLRGLDTIVGFETPLRSIVGAEELQLLPIRPVNLIGVRTLVGTVLAIVVAIVVALLVSRPLALRALAPVLRLHGALSQIAETGVAVPSPRYEGDSYGDLISTYNRAIDALNGALMQRDAAQAQLHQFIADAGHQLRTPLTVLSGFLGVLQRGQLRDPGDEPVILEKMKRQIEIMRKLVERLMLLEQWNETLAAPAPTDIGEFVRSIVDPIAASNPERSIWISSESGAISRVDTTELAYAVTNLVANAIKYAPQSHIRVITRSVDGVVTIAVSDGGPGIPPDELPRVFDRFYRGERRDVPGSGLGLSIAKTAVERSGGTLTVASEPGKGATFTITLPRQA